LLIGLNLKTFNSICTRTFLQVRLLASSTDLLGDGVNLVLSTVLQILIYVLKTYSFFIIASAVLRLVRADESNGLVSFVHTISDPPARYLSRKFPKLVMRNGPQIIDLGPIVVLLLIGALIIVLQNAQLAVRF
jgi:uncharacterized protein YggT (Ycf19 family)